MKKLFLLGLLLAVAVMTTGCASYSTKFVNTAQVDESKLVKNNSNDVSIVAFPILTEKESRDYFDEDLISKEVLAVYLSILNSASEGINFINASLSDQVGKEYVQLPKEEVYKYIRRGYGVKATLWFLTTYGVGGPASAVHTKSVNNKIEEDLQAKMLKSGNIRSKEATQGFLWFKLSEEIISEKNAKLVLKLTFDQNGKSVIKDLSFPAPKAD